jgi:hypothetical protein
VTPDAGVITRERRAIVRGPTVSLLEGFSKAATTISIVLIVVFQIAVNPDATPAMRAASAMALALGFAVGGRGGQLAVSTFITAAPLMASVLWRATGREGPVLDLIWLAGLAGALLRASSWLRWHLPPAWRVLLGGWALTLSLSWPVLVAREIGFDPRVLWDVGAINSWAMLGAPQVVSWITYLVLAQLLGLVWLEWLMTRLADTPLRVPRAAHALWFGTTIATLVAIYQGTVNLQFLNGSLWVAVRRAGATMLDANAYGVAAAFAAPVAVVAIWQWRGRIAPTLAIVVGGLNLTGMWMSGSRTALMCAAVGMAALVIASIWRRWSVAPQPAAALVTSETVPAHSRRRWIAVAILAAIIGSATIAAVSSQTVGPLRRVAQAPTTNGIVSALWSRYGYGTIAMRMVRDFPLTGIGIGGYQFMAPDYWRRMTGKTLALDSAQNWWRHELAEFGIVGAAPIFIWSGFAAWQLLRRRAVRDGVVAAVTLRGLLLALVVASLVQVPTQSPFVLLWFFFAVAWLAALVGLPALNAPGNLRTHRFAWCAVTVAAIVFSAGHLVLAAGRLSVLERARVDNREYVTGGYNLEPLDFGKFRWVPEHAHFLVPARNGVVIIRLWAQHPDIATHPVHVKLAGACGVIFDESLSNADPIALEVRLPPGVNALEFEAEASRTWQPSAFGGNDRRHLGVAIQTDFSYNGRQWRLSNMRRVNVASCAAR